MSTDILSPFSEAACQTFKLLLDLDVTAENLDESRTCMENIENVNIVIQITGDISGEVMYRFPKATTLEMVKIMSGMEFNEVDEFVKSALGEVANIISGNALTGLSQYQVVCDIKPPKIVDGNALIPTSGDACIYKGKVSTSIGDVELKLRTTKEI